MYYFTDEINVVLVLFY